MANTSTTSPTPLESRRVFNRLTASKALFFAAAGLSFCLSIALWFSGDRERGLFVGLWVPSILAAANLFLLGGSRD
ncbi:MAG: hypothetical protein PVI24_18380 [Myxococcales bacterium]|jgi:hypothetical protein